MLCLSRAGGHFEVDYGASVNVGGDADHNDDSGDADHNDVDVGGDADHNDVDDGGICQAPSWWTACSTW